MIDISVPLFNGIDPYEGDPAFEQSLVYSVDKGDIANVSKLVLSAHTGTHVDAPYHYFNDGKPIDQVDLKKFMGPCHVIEIPDNELENNLVTKKSLPKSFKYPRVLLKTKNSNHPAVFDRNFVGINLECAKYLVENKIELIGIDGFSIEEFTGDGSVHKELLSHEIAVLEIIDLSHVNPGDYNLICLPLRIKSCDASPARAILQPL